MSYSGKKGWITKPKLGVRIDPCHPLSRGLVGCWLFNEGAGSGLYDISGQGNHGTLTNMEPPTDWVGSLHGGALEFDGATDYVDVANESNFDFERTDPLSISAWFRTSDGGPENTLLGNLDTALKYRGFAAYMHTTYTGRMQFFLANSAYSPVNLIRVVADPRSDDGEWHHFVVTYDGSSSASGVNIYIDGVQVSTTTDENSLSATTLTNVTLRIGKYSASASDWWDGPIDDIRIYNRVLSAQEARQLYTDPYCNLLTRPWIVAPAVGVIELAATALSQSATPDDAALAALRELAAVTLAQSITPDDAILGLSLPMTAILASASTTPNDAVLAVAREMAATVLAQSTTPDTAALAVTRALAATLTAQSVTPDDAVLTVIGIIEFAATLLAQSATTDTGLLAVTRELAATALAQSVTPDDAVLGLIWQLAAAISAQSATPDVAALAVARELAAVLVAASITPSAVLAVLRELAAAILAQSVTPDDAALTVAAVVIELAAILLAQSLTPDDAILTVPPIVTDPSRIFRVALEGRTDNVEGEIRTFVVPLEDRTLEMN